MNNLFEFIQYQQNLIVYLETNWFNLSIINKSKLLAEIERWGRIIDYNNNRLSWIKNYWLRQKHIIDPKEINAGFLENKNVYRHD